MATEQALDFSINALKEAQLTPPMESRSRVSSGSSERTSPALSAHSPSPQYPTSTTTQDHNKTAQFPNLGPGTTVPPFNQFSPFTLSALLAAKNPLAAGYTSSAAKLGLAQMNFSDGGIHNLNPETKASLLSQSFGSGGLAFPSLLSGAGMGFGDGVISDPLQNPLLAKHLFGTSGPFPPQEFSNGNSAFQPTSPLTLSAAIKNRRRNIVNSRQSPIKVSPMKHQQSVTPSSEGTPSETQETPKKLDGTESPANTPNSKKDDAYWERRRRNNEAAKRSRDARRAKEEEIAMRATVLEQENLKLRAQVAILKNETAKLHLMLFSNAQSHRNTANEA